MINEPEQCVRVAPEGWLVGQWVDELRKESEQLRELAGRQVEYVNCSTLLSRQLKEATL